MRRPDLRAVEHIVVAVAHRFQLQRGEVGARSGFRITLTPIVFARENTRQIEILLFLRAIFHQHRRAHAKTHGGEMRRAIARAFRRPDIFLHVAPARAAIFDRPVRRHPALLVEDLLPLQVPLLVGENTGGQRARFFQFRRQILVEKGAHFIAKRSVGAGEIEVHCLSRSFYEGDVASSSSEPVAHLSVTFFAAMSRATLRQIRRLTRPETQSPRHESRGEGRLAFCAKV